MSALAEVVYRELRRKGAKASEAYIYKRPQKLSMVTEKSVSYEDGEEIEIFIKGH